MVFGDEPAASSCSFLIDGSVYGCVRARVLWQGLNTMSARGGGMHSLVLTTEGLFAFGRNDFGQVGCSEKINAADWGVFVNRPTEVRLALLTASNDLRFVIRRE